MEKCLLPQTHVYNAPVISMRQSDDEATAKIGDLVTVAKDGKMTAMLIKITNDFICKVDAD